MANVRAGIAYVDVRLGSIEDLKNGIKKGVEDIGKEAGQKLGDNIKKNVPSAEIGKKLGTDLDKQLTSAFFQDAKNEFGAGFRALANKDLGSAKALFKSAGQNLGMSLKQGFSNVSNFIGTSLQSVVGLAQKVGTAVGNAAKSGWNKFQEFGQMLDKASQKMGFLAFQIQNFGLIASVAFTGPTVAALGFASAVGIKTAAKIEAATAALKFLLPKGYDVEALLNRLKKLAIESPIFDTSDLITYTQKFTAAGVQIDKTTRFLSAFSNIALVTGASTDEANRAITAITQVFGKGKLQAEELNQQLGEAMPSVLKLLRDQFGVTQKELTQMVKEGKISGDDLIEAFTKIGESKKFLDGAAHGAQTLNGVWQEFKESLQTQLGQIFLDNSKEIKDGIKGLGTSLSQLITDATPVFIKMISGFKSLVDLFSKVVKWYSSLSPGTQDLIMKLVLLAAAVGPVVIALGSLLGAFAGIAAGIAAIATPAGAVIAAIIAIGAAVAGLIVWYKKFGGENSALGKAISSAWDYIYKNVLTPIGHAFQDFWKQLVEAFNQVKSAIGGNTDSWKTWGTILSKIWFAIKAQVIAFVSAVVIQFKGVLETLGYVVKAIASIISGIIKIFKGWTDFISGVFHGDWDKALHGLLEVWNGVWDLVYGTLANLSKALGTLVITIYKTIVGYFQKLYDVLVGHSIIPDLVKAILMWFGKLAAPIKAAFSAISSAVKSFATIVNNFVKNVASGVTTVINYFKNLASKIKGAFGSAASWLYSAGKNIVQGLVNGVRSMGGYLKNAILNLIPGPVRSIVSNALGINSPSKVFEGYGRNVVQGFVNGISGEHRALANSMSVFSDSTRFEQINGSPAQPITNTSSSSGLSIENYYANDNVDPWRQAEDWYFIVTSRGGVT